MKKLMILAAVAAMALGAKADYSASLNATSISLTLAADGETGVQNYSSFFVLLPDAFSSWKQNSNALADLNSASIIAGTADYVSGEDAMKLNYLYGHAFNGEVTKFTETLPFDIVMGSANAVFVAASANDYYYGEGEFISYGSVYKSMSMSGQTPTSFGSTPAPIPEPTSGLMMLIGLAGLALKRKVQG